MKMSFNPAAPSTPKSTGRSPGPVLAVASVAALGLLGTACRVQFDTDLGDTVTESFEIDDFSELVISGAFDVEVEVGPATSLEVDIEEDLLDDLDINQSGDRLRIELDSGWFTTSNGIRIRLTTPTLDDIELTGAVGAEVTGLDSEDLRVELQGASNVTGEGLAEQVTISADGASSVDFDDVEIDEVDVDVNGASSVDVNGASSVTGSLNGASSVDVSDSANVNVNTSGASSVD